jgi:hypothetical protein
LQKKENDDDDVIVNSKIQEVKDGPNTSRSSQNKDVLKKKKVHSSMPCLESSFTHEASTLLQNIEQGRKILPEQEKVPLFSGIMIDEEPSNFDEA